MYDHMQPARHRGWAARRRRQTGMIPWLLALLLGCSQPQSAALSQSGAPDAVAPQVPDRLETIVPAVEHLLVRSTPQPAQVSAYEQTDIYSKVAGYVETLGMVPADDGTRRPVDIGERVKKNQTLARLWAPEMEQEQMQKAALVEQAKAQLQQSEATRTAAEAMVDAAQAQLQEARAQIVRYEADVQYRQSQYERYVALVQQRAVRQELQDEALHQLQAAQAAQRAAQAAVTTAQASLKVQQARQRQAEADVAAAEARLKVAMADYQHAGILLRYATITAPYDGIVTRRLVDTGAFVQSATAGGARPLFTVARVDRLRIVTHVPEAEAGAIRIGQRALFQTQVAGSEPLRGAVVRYADALDSATRTMRVELELDSPPESLRPGVFGSVTIVLADVPDALLVPATAVVQDEDRSLVFVLQDGQVRPREVQLGVRDNGRVQVLHGLSGQEPVLARAAQWAESARPP